jgi:hypothetical protein
MTAMNVLSVATMLRTMLNLRTSVRTIIKRRMTMKQYNIYDKVFKCQFRLYINCTYTRFIKAVTPYFDDMSIFDEWCEDAPALCVDTPDGGIIILVQEFDYNNPEHIATLTHECVHAAQKRLWEMCGVPVQDMETPAYYVGYLVNEFLTKIKADMARSTR